MFQAAGIVRRAALCVESIPQTQQKCRGAVISTLQSHGAGTFGARSKVDPTPDPPLQVILHQRSSSSGVRDPPNEARPDALVRFVHCRRCACETIPVTRRPAVSIVSLQPEIAASTLIF